MDIAKIHFTLVNEHASVLTSTFNYKWQKNVASITYKFVLDFTEMGYSMRFYFMQNKLLHPSPPIFAATLQK